MLNNRKFMFGDRAAVGHDIAINGIGVQEHMDPYLIDRPCGSGDCLLMLFYDPVVVRVGSESRRVAAGHAMVWPRGERQCYGNPTAAFRHSWIHCDGAFVADRLTGIGVPVAAPFRVPEPPTVDTLLGLIAEEILNHLAPSADVVRGLVAALFAGVARGASASAPVAEPPARLIEAKRLIETHYAESIDLDRLAQTACMSVPHFCSQFKRNFGTSAIRYLVRVRLDHALHLLRNRNMPVSHVAFSVGFASLPHFSATFRKRFGEGPRAVRARLLRGVSSPFPGRG
jgi:AraC-like DNA-binding protein